MLSPGCAGHAGQRRAATPEGSTPWRPAVSISVQKVAATWSSPATCSRRESVEPIEALTEKGVSARLDGVGSEQGVEARHLGSGAPECEQRDGQSADKKESTSTEWVGAADQRQPESEVRGLSVAKSFFNREATGVAVDDLARGDPDEAGGEAPGLFHAFFFDADDGSNGKTLECEENGLDFIGASVAGNPVLCLL